MSTIPTPTAGEVLDDLRAIIRTLLQLAAEDHFVIESDSTLTDELGLESIDLVNIGALLTERYGEAVNLAVYLADQEIDDVIKLTVGTLVGFVLDALAVAGDAGGTAAVGTVAGSAAVAVPGSGE